MVNAEKHQLNTVPSQDQPDLVFAGRRISNGIWMILAHFPAIYLWYELTRFFFSKNVEGHTNGAEAPYVWIISILVTVVIFSLGWHFSPRKYLKQRKLLWAYIILTSLTALGIIVYHFLRMDPLSFS